MYIPCIIQSCRLKNHMLYNFKFYSVHWGFCLSSSSSGFSSLLMTQYLFFLLQLALLYRSHFGPLAEAQLLCLLAEYAVRLLIFTKKVFQHQVGWYIIKQYHSLYLVFWNLQIINSIFSNSKPICYYACCTPCFQMSYSNEPVDLLLSSFFIHMVFYFCQ